jgi:hypothetical protein
MRRPEWRRSKQPIVEFAEWAVKSAESSKPWKLKELSMSVFGTGNA